jgi:hypothetical protein
MNLLGLSCRGLGLDAAVGELRDLVRSHNPEVVLLSETKTEEEDNGASTVELRLQTWFQCGWKR